MGWKSTVEITREEAIRLIFARLSIVNELTNAELSDLIEALGYGENIELPYYGHNFLITYNQDQE